MAKQIRLREETLAERIERTRADANRCKSVRTRGSKRSARCEWEHHGDSSFHMGRSPGGYWFSWHDDTTMDRSIG